MLCQCQNVRSPSVTRLSCTVATYRRIGSVASRMQYVELWSRSDSASSCSRIRLPSRSVKRRTQPTWSDGSPPSISDSATTGCHAV